MKFPDIIETEHFRFVNYTQLSLEDSKKMKFHLILSESKEGLGKTKQNTINWGLG